jgi:hypothetical protein
MARSRSPCAFSTARCSLRNSSESPNTRPLSPFCWKVLFDPITLASQNSSYGRSGSPSGQSRPSDPASGSHQRKGDSPYKNVENSGRRVVLDRYSLRSCSAAVRCHSFASRSARLRRISACCALVSEHLQQQVKDASNLSLSFAIVFRTLAPSVFAREQTEAFETMLRIAELPLCSAKTFVLAVNPV